jgi:hypothetical protein
MQITLFELPEIKSAGKNYEAKETARRKSLWYNQFHT